MYKLNQGDLQDIEMLKNVQSAILEVYFELYKLEKEGNKATPEFEELIERLKNLRNLESDMKDRVFCSTEQITAVIEKLRENYFVPFDNEKCAFQTDPLESAEELVSQRLVNSTFLSFMQHTEEDNKRKINDVTIPAEEKLKIEASLAVENFEMYLFCDCWRINLAILAQEDRPNLNDKLLWVKYGIAFSLPNIEQDLINDKFSVNPNPYLTAPLVGKIYPHIVINFSANLMRRIVFSMALDQLVRHYDMQLINPDTMTSVLIQATLLRSSIVVLSDDEANILIDEINKTIEGIMNDPSKKMIVRILQDVVDSRRKDKEMLQIVSINL